MVGVGFLMLAIILVTLYLSFEGQVENNPRFLRLLLPAMALPYLANSTGWILAEVGRQPWIVFGLQRVEDAVSPNLTVGDVLLSLILFTVIYGVLAAADVYLLRKYAIKGITDWMGADGPQDTTPNYENAYAGD